MILIIDDDNSIRTSLSFILRKEGYEIATAINAQKAKEWLSYYTPSVILMDMNFSISTTGQEGLALLKDVHNTHPTIPVILMTAWGSIELAVSGMKAGAWDFISKPWNNKVLLQRIKTAIELSKTSDLPSNNYSKETQDSTFDRNGIIGESEEIKKVLELVKRVAHTNASVLITGESGTGKEMIAEILHRNSARNKAPFVKVNLGGISQSLFESEMFGHKKGSFTDAYSDRIGRFEMANKGTIFLDEIGDLDLPCQVKLLRVLQDQTYEMLGDSKTKTTDIRVIAATNKDLEKAIKENLFREDLYYRINLITIHVPALRERRSDIPLLVKYFMRKFATDNGIEIGNIEDKAIEELCRYPFLGNIRELKNLVERLMLIRKDPIITLDSVKSSYKETYLNEETKQKEDKGLTLNDIEIRRIKEELDRCNGNLSQVARELGITRQTLYRRMKKYNIR